MKPRVSPRRVAPQTTMTMKKFTGRVQVGTRLAGRLKPLLRKGESAVVVSLPRGGVPVGLAVAAKLGLPHDIMVTRKIPEEKRSEWSVGAVAEDGSTVWDESRAARERPAYLKRARLEQLAEAKRRLKNFRQAAGPAVPLAGKTVIIADDGVSRGWTLLSAIGEVKERHAARIIVAVPIAPKTVAKRLRQAAGEAVILLVSDRLPYVSNYYRDKAFMAVEDKEVKEMLRRNRRR